MKEVEIMALVAMKCPNCSANIELDDSREFGFCSYCGTKVMQERIIVEHKGGVVLDNTEKLKNLHILAERALNSGDNTKAREHYDEILLESPNDWKAVFYSVFLKKDETAPMADDYGKFFNQVTDTMKSVFNLIKNLPESEQKKCCSLIAKEVNDYASAVLNYAVNSEEKAVEGLGRLRYSDVRILTKKMAEGYLFAALIASYCAVDIHNIISKEEKELITTLLFTGLRLTNCSSRWYDMGEHDDHAFSSMVTLLEFLENVNPEAAEEIIKELPISCE